MPTLAPLWQGNMAVKGQGGVPNGNAPCEGLRLPAHSRIYCGMTDLALSRAFSSAKADPLALAKGLIFVAILVWITVIVGGITRLTESGLSITEWNPVEGILPPLTDAAWREAFDKYKLIPEYILINGPAGMDLSDFKVIFFWEWVHRILGRLVGLSLIVVTAWAWIRGAIPAGYKPRLLALIALVGLQGAFGWYMVASGMAVRTDVSHFRLSMHLLTALFILGGLVWTILDLRHKDKGPAKLTFNGLWVIGVLFIQLLLGAWVAGLNAGYVAGDWPMMQGQFLPAGIDWGKGVGFALTHDPILLHWLHRWWAWVAVAALVILARAAKKAGDRRASVALHSAFGVQILLGIATVMTGMNLHTAATHQAVGALVVVATIWCAHVIGRRM
jgi:heme a synthase